MICTIIEVNKSMDLNIYIIYNLLFLVIFNGENISISMMLNDIILFWLNLMGAYSNFVSF